MKQKLSEHWKSYQAMRQANVDLRQLPGMARKIRLWLQITRNLKEIKGSWPAALGTYTWIFKGTLRKHRQRVPGFRRDQ